MDGWVIWLAIGGLFLAGLVFVATRPPRHQDAGVDVVQIHEPGDPGLREEWAAFKDEYFPLVGRVVGVRRPSGSLSDTEGGRNTDPNAPVQRKAGEMPSVSSEDVPDPGSEGYREYMARYEWEANILDVRTLGEWVRDNAPHVAILGATRSGKTSLVKALIRLLQSSFVIIDPNYKVGSWGDSVSAYRIDPNGEWTSIQSALAGVWAELENRVLMAHSREVSGPEFYNLSVVIDEVNEVYEEVVGFPEMLSRMLRRAAGYNIRLMICPHSDNVNELGLSVNTRRNLVWIYLGEHARTLASTLDRAEGSRTTYRRDWCREQAYPCLLRIGDDVMPVDLSGVPEVTGEGLDPKLAAALPEVRGTSGQEEDPRLVVLAKLVKAGKLARSVAIEVGLGQPAGSAKEYRRLMTELNRLVGEGAEGEGQVSQADTPDL